MSRLPWRWLVKSEAGAGRGAGDARGASATEWAAGDTTGRDGAAAGSIARGAEGRIPRVGPPALGLSTLIKSSMDCACAPDAVRAKPAQTDKKRIRFTTATS